MSLSINDQLNIVNLISRLSFEDQLKFPDEVRNGLRDFTSAEVDLYGKLLQSWNDSKAEKQVELIQRLPKSQQLEFDEPVRLGLREMTPSERNRCFAYLNRLLRSNTKRKERIVL